jgi:hypothetical protein
MDGVEPLYTIRELVKETGRGYDFWDGQCRRGHLAFSYSAGERGTRVIRASALKDWRRRMERRAQARREVAQPSRRRRSEFRPALHHA